MREHPDPDHLLKPNDHITVWAPAQTWQCLFCRPPGGDGAMTTVEWIGAADGPDGRCRDCGAKYRLAKVGDSVPTIEEQLEAAHLVGWFGVWKGTNAAAVDQPTADGGKSS